MNANFSRQSDKIHLTNFHLAGFSYWDGPEAFEALKIGLKLDLVREQENKFDPYAVAIYFGTYKLGYIPRNYNEDISKYLDMGLEDIYEVRIQRISPDKHTEEQIGVIVYIKNQRIREKRRNRSDRRRLDRVEREELNWIDEEIERLERKNVRDREDIMDDGSTID